MQWVPYDGSCHANMSRQAANDPSCQSEHAWRQQQARSRAKTLWFTLYCCQCCPPETATAHHNLSVLSPKGCLLIIQIKTSWIINLGISWIALVDVMICISQATFWPIWGDRAECFKRRLLMINGDNSVFCRHLAWMPFLWGMKPSYWLSLRPTLHFVSVSGRLRDRRARQSYKVKYLGLALALQVSVIILLEAFLLCWIIMEVRVYACHLSSVGGENQREAQDREMFAFLLCHPRSTRVRQTCIVPRAEMKLHKQTLIYFCLTCDSQLGIFSAANVIMKHVLQRC